MKLQTKILVITFILFVLALSFIGLILFNGAQTNLENKIKNQMESLSDTTENNIDTFIEAQKNKIELIATQSELSREELIRMIELDPSFYDLFVINSSGVVTVSSNPARIGLDRSNRTYFTQARNQTYVSPVYLALVPNEYSIAVSTPFHGGVLVGAMKIGVLNGLVESRVGLGDTGESLLAFMNEKGSVVYFTERRFSSQFLEVIPIAQAKGRPIYYALQGEEKFFTNIKNYRSKDVLSVTNYIEAIHVGMVTQIDTDEAFLEINNLKKKIIIYTIISILIILFIIYIFSKQISKELIELSESIEKITKGNLDIQLNKSNLEEIQILINSLNRILASMKLAILRTGISKSELGIGDIVKAKEEAEDRYRILYENSSRAIMTLEPPEWKFTAGNPATLKMFRVKDEKELTSLSPGDLSPEKQPDGSSSSTKAKKMIEKAMKEGSAKFQWIHKRYKGESFPAEVDLIKMKIGGKEVLQAIVTELKEKDTKK